MARGFAIHNAPTDHGGIIPSTQVRSSQQGNAFVRADDGHFCPKCKCWSKVVKSHDHVIFDGKAVAYAGDKLTCGATILRQQSHVVGDSGSTNFSFNASNFQFATSLSTNNFKPNQIKEFGQKFLVVDESTSEPLANVHYEIHKEGSLFSKGVTDEQGYTQFIAGAENEEIELKIVAEDKDHEHCCKP